MFDTMQKGLAVYVAALTEYKKFQDTTGKGGELSLSDSQYPQAQRYRVRLEAMAQTLGLSKEEVANYEKEFGIKNAEEPSYLTFY